VVYLADHPATGGYPVVATLGDADAGSSGQFARGRHPIRPD
jgi:allophanate hydrolase subunit 2